MESTVEAMEKLGAERSGIVAAIGPLIRQHSYEVGGEFIERFVEADAENALFFLPSAREGHAMFDLAGFIRMRLENNGVLMIDDFITADECAAVRALLQLSPLGTSQRAGLRQACSRHRPGVDN